MKRVTEMIDFELVAEDAKRVERAAAAAGQTLSDFVAVTLERAVEHE